MARLAATYRGARCTAARLAKTPMWKFTTVKVKETTEAGEIERVVRAELDEPRYMPYFTKEPRIKLGKFQVGPVPSAADITVPYTDLRKQPRVYR